MKKLTGIFAVLIFLLFSGSAAAETVLQKKSTEDPMKVWTITFSKQVDPDTIHSQSIFLKDSKGRTMRVKPVTAPNRLKVELHPESPYQIGESYTILITDHVKSMDGLSLKTAVKMPFTLEPKGSLDPGLRAKAIQEQWELLQPRYAGTVLRDIPSVAAPYSLGNVEEAALRDALNLTNFIRFIAYLPGDVTLNEQFNLEAQAASVVNAANQQITHYPVKPQGMDNALYELGFSGASTSNIGLGYRSIVDSIQRGYMSDADDSNRDRVGHRRWVLSPKLREVGFGFAIASNNRAHTAMKVIAPEMWRNPSVPYDTIAWPSHGAFPVSFMGDRDPWSISLNEEIYDNFKTDQVVVTLIRESDRREWRFSQHDSPGGFFTIDNGNYGHTPYTIIFQPTNAGEYRADERYTVQIEGVVKRTGEETSIQYVTTFFNLK